MGERLRGQNVKKALGSREVSFTLPVCQKNIGMTGRGKGRTFSLEKECDSKEKRGNRGFLPRGKGARFFGGVTGRGDHKGAGLGRKKAIFARCSKGKNAAAKLAGKGAFLKKETEEKRGK